jgi:endonuclease III-like uncharacterized protein
MNTNSNFEEVKKAQQIVMEAIDKSARTNLETAEKLLEINKQRFNTLSEVTSPGDYFARQSSALKEYAEQMSAHVEALGAIGSDSREQLTELSQDFAKNLDFSAFFPFGEQPAKTKTKSGAKNS